MGEKLREQEKGTVEFRQGCRLQSRRSCKFSMPPINRATGVFGPIWCGEPAVTFCRHRGVERLPVLGWIEGMPVIAAGVSSENPNALKGYLKNAWEYDVMPDLSPEGEQVFSLYKRLPRGRGAGYIEPPKAFWPVNGNLRIKASMPRWSACRVCR